MRSCTEGGGGRLPFSRSRIANLFFWGFQDLFGDQEKVVQVGWRRVARVALHGRNMGPAYLRTKIF